jgi:tetratricopeptide (TPR) repeat protein
MLAFLRDDLLSVADPFAGNTERPRGRNLTLLAAVDLAARNVRQRFPDQPLVEAGLRVTLWQVYFALGDLDQAEEHIQRSLELYDATPDAPELDRLKALESVAWMHHARGRYADATGLIEPVLERRTRLQGVDHPEVLSAQRCRLAILSSSGRHPEAMALGEDLLNRARQLPVEHTEVLLRIMGDVSWVWYRQGEYRRCYELSEEAFNIAQEKLGNDHSLTTELMGDWAKWLRLRLGRFHEAERLQQEAYDRARETLGELHELTLTSLSELALLADARGLFGERLEMQEALVPLSRQAFGPHNPNSIFEQMRLGWGRLEEGRPEDAEALLTDALERLRKTRGADDFMTRRALRWLPGVLAAQGKFDQALELRLEVADGERRVLGPDSPGRLMTLYEAANLHARIGQWPKAAQLFIEVLPHYDPTKSIRPREDLYSPGLVTAVLAGDDAAVRTLGPLALRHARQTSEPWKTRRELILTLLLATDVVSNGSELETIATQFLSDTQPALRDTLLPGLLALRQSHHFEALRLVAPQSGNPAHPSAGLASAFAAMAQHRLGNTIESVNLLSEARDHLERLGRAGDLGWTTWYPNEEWLPAAQLVLACREAELLIHGQLIEPVFDETILANARVRWLPVRALLNEADRAASRGDWKTALDDLRTAIRHEQFDWSAAMQSREHFAAKAAALSAFGNELSPYHEVIERVVHSDNSPGALSAGTFLLLQNDSLPPATLESLVTMARLTAEDAPASDGGNPWWSLELGLAELRADNAHAALTALEPAAGAYNLRCSGAAQAVATLALWQLGNHAPAHQRLAQARDAFQQLTDGNRQSLGPNWHEMLLLELVLQKASQALKNGG